MVSVWLFSNNRYHLSFLVLNVIIRVSLFWVGIDNRLTLVKKIGKNATTPGDISVLSLKMDIFTLFSFFSQKLIIILLTLC